MSSDIISQPVSSDRDDRRVQRVEVPLTFDAEFFTNLQAEVSNFDTLQSEEQIRLTKEIQDLGRTVARIASPSKSKTDLERWRELFDLYLQAAVFFSTNEQDHGSRNSTVARTQFQWFQTEITNKGIARSFKLAASREALEQFTKINMTLWRNLRFQEINQLAVTKILKSLLTILPFLASKTHMHFRI
jgi:E3 ubiquitin-protein ligase BAH